VTLLSHGVNDEHPITATQVVSSPYCSDALLMMNALCRRPNSQYFASEHLASEAALSKSMGKHSFPAISSMRCGGYKPIPLYNQLLNAVWELQD